MALVSKSALEALFNATIEALAAKIKSGEATAADLNVARQMLKDNGIELAPIEGNAMHNLVTSLPFTSEEKYN
jgi:hypothetical protein